MKKLQYTYGSDDMQRLDKYLVSLEIKELFSRTFIEKLIAEDMIEVNHIPVKKSLLLQKGDTISIILPEQQPKDIEPQDIPIDIIFEDENMAVVNKPAGMIVHPGFGNPDNTLVNAIVFRYGAGLNSDKNINRPGIVHRLDKGTSGLMLIAKNDATQSVLSDMFAKREVKKTYLAITTGIPNPSDGTIETYISRSIANPRKMSVTNDGRLSLTHYRVIHFYYYFALCEINLETGRMHQIRVHFADKNFPVLGDLLYNTVKNVQSNVPENMKKKVHDLLSNHMKRQALHAWKLEFVHPYTKALCSFTAPIPDDITYTLDWLEQYFAIDNVRYDKKLLK